MKLCKHNTCTYPVFSHLYCSSHQYLRTDSGYLKKQAAAKEKRYHPVKKVTRDLNFGFKGELDMFEHIWEDRSHICQFTGESLDQFYGTTLWVSCFAHILPKGKFPLFKLYAKNVELVYPTFHHIVDFGTIDHRKDRPQWNFKSWDKLVQKMKEEYMEFKKANLLA